MVVPIRLMFVYMKSNIILFLSILVSVVFASNVNAQSVTVNAEIDTFQRLIGEQAKITLQVAANSDSRVVLPIFDKELIEGVEIIHKSQPDTQYLNGRKRMEIKEVYTVTSFDSSLYVIPPFEVIVDGTPHFSKELAMAVYMMPIDTTNLTAFFGPKDIWRFKLAWSDLQSSFWLGLFLLLSIACCLWGVIRYLNNKPIVRIIKIKPKLPPHVVALNEMERIKGDDKWRIGGRSKEYYTELTDVVRNYLYDRFGIDAKDMTTNEIVESLMTSENVQSAAGRESIKELQEVLVMADLVKFAKFEPAMNENDRNLVTAIEFVNRTKILETEVAPQPTEKKIVNRRSKRAKTMLLIAVIVLATAAVTLLVMFIRELYYLFV